MLAVFPGAKCYKQSDLAVFIVSPEKYEQNKIYAQLEGVFDAIRSRIAGKMIFTVTMGVGEYFPNIRDIHKSYRQARTSINLGYQIEKFDCILFYSRMGIYRLLSSIAGTDEAREFIERYVRPLADYDAKYNGQVQEITPARLSKETTERVQLITSTIYDILGCSGIIRIDYIITKQKTSDGKETERINMLEINTTPGMTATSFIPQQVRAAGLEMKDVLTDIIEDKLAR